jgi:hypothetical protein
MWRLYLGLIALTIIVLGAVLALQSPPTSKTPMRAPTGDGVGSARYLVEVEGSSLELSVNWRFIVDGRLFRELVARIESHSREYPDLHPDDVRVLELLKEDPRVIAILEVNVTLTNMGPESVYVLCGGGYVGLLRSKLMEILNQHDSGSSCTYVSVEPVKGEVVRGFMMELLSLVAWKPEPGGSISNLFYFVTKKPSPEEPFIAKLHVETGRICKVYDVNCEYGATSKRLKVIVDIKFG